MSDTRKVILNKCYGGYGFSVKAHKEYCKAKNIPCYVYVYTCDTNNSSILVKWDTDDEPNTAFIWYITKDNVNKLDDIHDEDMILLERVSREDSTLIDIVERLGKEANSRYSELKIVEIPNSIKEYVIDDYDGYETLHEKVQVW